MAQQARRDQPQVSQRRHGRHCDDAGEAEYAQSGDAKAGGQTHHDQIGGGTDGGGHASDQHRIVHRQQHGAGRYARPRGGRKDQRDQQYHHRRVVDHAADTGGAQQHGQQRQARFLANPHRQSPRSRLQCAGDHQRMAQHHQRTDRHERGVTQAGEEPAGLYRPVRPGIRHQFEAQRNGHQHRQADGGHRPSVPDENGQQNHCKEPHRNTVRAQVGGLQVQCRGIHRGLTCLGPPCRGWYLACPAK